MDSYEARSLGRREDLFPGSLAPVSLQAGSRFQMEDGHVVRYGGRLLPEASRAFPALPDGQLLAATDDLRMLVLATTEGVALVTDDHVTLVDVEGTDSGTVLESGIVLLTATSHTAVGRGRHQVVAIDAERGDVIDAADLPATNAGGMTVAHPDGRSAVVNAGMGQDGCVTVGVTVQDGSLHLGNTIHDLLPASFTSDGSRLLLGPHSNRDEVALVRWPNLEPVAMLTPGDCAVDDAFEIYACHVQDDAILVMTIEGTIILTDGSLVPRGRVELAGHTGEMVSLYALGPQQFATVSWTGGSNVTEVWQLGGR